MCNEAVLAIHLALVRPRVKTCDRNVTQDYEQKQQNAQIRVVQNVGCVDVARLAGRSTLGQGWATKVVCRDVQVHLCAP